MNIYARGIAVLLLAGFGLIALFVGVGGVYRLGAPGQDAAAKALAQYVSPILVLLVGFAALVAAWWLGRGFKEARDEGDRI